MWKASITQDLESLCSSTTSWNLSSPPKASLTPKNCRCSEGSIQNRASELRRTPIPRTSVNKGKRKKGGDLHKLKVRAVSPHVRHPSGIGESPLSLRSVAQPPPGHGDQHNRERTKAAQDRQEAVVLQDGSGKERSQDPSNKPIKARVNQDGHKHAAFRVVEDPRVHDGQAGGRKDKHNDVECSELIPRRQEKGQVPQRPEGTEDQAPEQRTVQRLQPGQSKPAPARLFAKRSS